MYSAALVPHPGQASLPVRVLVASSKKRGGPGMIDPGQVWTVILTLGAGSFALRFVFIGLVGNRPLPLRILRHLRYTAVAVLSALIAPLVLWPPATGGVVLYLGLYLAGSPPWGQRRPSLPSASSWVSPPTRGKGRPLSVTATATRISPARGESFRRTSTPSKCDRT